MRSRSCITTPRPIPPGPRSGEVVKTPVYERHTFVYLNLSGRKRIFEELAGKGFDEREIGEVLLPEQYNNGGGIMAAIPGVARREESEPSEGRIPLGFASWRSSESGRLRFATFALPGEIIAAVTPGDVAAKAAALDSAATGRSPAIMAFTHLSGAWSDLPLKLGLWGSAALEIETGYAYTHQWSDLDLLLLPVGPVDRSAFQRCLNMVLATEKKFDLRIDAELLVPGGYGVSLKELLSGSSTALGKGLTDVVLLQKTELFAGLAGNQADIV